jgi:hypothetical protein
VTIRKLRHDNCGAASRYGFRHAAFPVVTALTIDLEK